MKRVIVIVVFFSLVSIFVLQSQSNRNQESQLLFRNPIISSDVADPTIIKFGDKYYLAGTSSEWAPFYPMFESVDLVNWTQIGHIFETQPEWTVSSFWAPELFVHDNGKVYAYYTARRRSDNQSFIGVATADHPAGVFTDHGVLVEYDNEAIDAFVFNDNGQLYISFKAYGLRNKPQEIKGVRLSADGLQVEGEMFTMLRDDEREGAEGQYHFKEGDYYYIVYAARGCCGPRSNYEVRVARAKSFLGPYEKYEGNPILHGGTVGDYQSIGHGTGVRMPDGRHIFVCHAYLNGDGFFLGRLPVLQEMFVDEDNWVRFRPSTFAKIEQPMPFLGTIQQPIPDFFDDFNRPQLDVKWTWNYTSTDVKTSMHNGNLRLSGAPKNNNYAGAAFCLRPSTVNYTYETRVVNRNPSMKGLTMYGGDRNLVAWGAENDKLRLKTFKNGEETILYESGLPRNVYVRIEVERGRYLNFYKSSNGRRWTKVNDEPLDMSSLVRWDRIARPGLIHIGEVSQPGEFSYFRLTNHK